MSYIRFISPGVKRIKVAYTAFVDYKYGSDARGIVERQDRPFQTIAAAVAAIGVFYPILPARIKVKVNGGTGTAPIILKSGIDFDLGNGRINTIGTGYAITDNGVAGCDSSVTGVAEIFGTGCISVTGAGSHIYVNARQLFSSGAAICIHSALSELDVVCDGIYHDSNSTLAFCDTGRQNILVTGTTTSAQASIFSVQTVGNVFECNTGIQTIRAAYDTVFDNTGNAIGALLSGGGVQSIYSNINGAIAVRNSGAGTQYIYGNLIASQTSFIGAATGTTYIFGNLTSTANIGTVNITGTGTTIIHGNVYSENAVPLTSTGGTTTVYGNVTTNTGTGCTSIFAPGILIINGDCTVINNAATIVIFGPANAGATLIINNSRITSPNAAGGAVLFPGNGVFILNNVTFVMPVASFSISGNAGETVNIHGACQANTAIVGAFAQQVGALNVNALVV